MKISSCMQFQNKYVLSILGNVLELHPLQVQQSLEHVIQARNVLLKEALLMVTVQLVSECAEHFLNLPVAQLFLTIVPTSKTLVTPQPIQQQVLANILSLPSTLISVS